MGYWSLVYRIVRATIRAGLTSMAYKSAIAKEDDFILKSNIYEKTNGCFPNKYSITRKRLDKNTLNAKRTHRHARTVREALFAEYRRDYGDDWPL